jgi:hypothetical protein
MVNDSSPERGSEWYRLANFALVRAASNAERPLIRLDRWMPFTMLAMTAFNTLPK